MRKIILYLFFLMMWQYAQSQDCIDTIGQNCITIKGDLVLNVNNISQLSIAHLMGLKGKSIKMDNYNTKQQELLASAWFFPGLKQDSIDFVTKNQITISIDEPLSIESYQWQIIDIAGSILKIGKFNHRVQTVNINDINSGIYMVQFIKENSLIKTEKFTIIR